MKVAVRTHSFNRNTYYDMIEYYVDLSSKAFHRFSMLIFAILLVVGNGVIIVVSMCRSISDLTERPHI